MFNCIYFPIIFVDTAQINKREETQRILDQLRLLYIRCQFRETVSARISSDHHTLKNETESILSQDEKDTMYIVYKLIDRVGNAVEAFALMLAVRADALEIMKRYCVKEKRSFTTFKETVLGTQRFVIFICHARS